MSANSEKITSRNDGAIRKHSTWQPDPNEYRYRNSVGAKYEKPDKPEALPENPSPEEQTAWAESMTAYGGLYDDYVANVEIAKSYVGMPRPDAETANRIVTLVLKMMEYAQVVFDAESEAKKLALESLIKGETPSAALLK